MTRLAAVLGVDYGQWRALVGAALKIDFRTSAHARTGGHREIKAASALAGQVLFYTAVGGLIAALVWFARDLFVTSVIVVTYVMFMVGTAALLDHNSAITSPDDYLILGWRPVSSRTYFAARLTSVLVYTLAMTTAFAYLPLAILAIRYGVAIGAAGAAAVYLASIATTLTMVVSYASLLRAVGAGRLKRLLSYLQLAASFVVYGGYFFVVQLVGEQVLAAAIEKRPWMVVAPPVWFASIVELAAGRWSILEVAPVGLGLIAIGALAMAIGGRLSLDYAAQLGAVMSAAGAQAPRDAKARPARWFRRDEGRAVAILIRGQFRNDVKFRMGVLAILPLTIVYILMAVQSGGLGDPFVQPRGPGFGFVTMAIMMFPAMLRMNLVRSDAYRASWIFFVMPVDRARIVRSSKDLLVVAFLLPYLLLVGAVLSYFSPSISHVGVHLLVVGLLSHLVLQIVIVTEPALPFSKPLVKGASASRVFFVMFIVGASATVLPLLAPVIYQSVTATVATIVALGLVAVALDYVTKMRVDALSATLEFEG